MSEEENIKSVQKILGEPVISSFDANTYKIRSMLFTFSVISIAYVMGELQIAPDSSFLGMKFIGLNDELLTIIFLVIIIYLTFHFIWCATDSFKEWRLRITGTKVAYVTGAKMGNKNSDYPNDPRQSTLYNWWKDQHLYISSINKHIDDINKSLDSVSSELEIAKTEGRNLNLNVVTQPLSSINNNTSRIKTELEAVKEIFLSERVPVSLKRFDEWFKGFLNSQNLRWLFIELLLPIILAVLALFLLTCRLYD